VVNDVLPRILWRISEFADLSGKGGMRASARWNTIGRRVVYLSDSPTGALLETLVHFELDPEDVPETYTRLKVAVPSDIEIEQLEPPDVVDWRLDYGLTRSVGDVWLAAGKTCLARVPSAIANDAWNYLLNPEHHDAMRVQIAAVTQERFDRRLFKVVR
jgi:RES domain-containing protein